MAEMAGCMAVWLYGLSRVWTRAWEQPCKRREGSIGGKTISAKNGRKHEALEEREGKWKNRKIRIIRPARNHLFYLSIRGTCISRIKEIKE